MPQPQAAKRTFALAFGWCVVTSLLQFPPYSWKYLIVFNGDKLTNIVPQWTARVMPFGFTKKVFMYEELCQVFEALNPEVAIQRSKANVLQLG